MDLPNKFILGVGVGVDYLVNDGDATFAEDNLDNADYNGESFLSYSSTRF